MPGTPGTRSELVAIPRPAWDSSGAGEIAGVALAIERRSGLGIPLPRESTRYPLVCDRLADLARTLVGIHVATTVWQADNADTRAWLNFAFRVFRWAQKPANDRFREGVLGLRRPFVPPDDLAIVVATFDEILRDHLSTWPDGDDLRPLLEPRLHAYRAAGDSGLVECILFSPVE